jgi:hypothetical protein
MVTHMLSSKENHKSFIEIFLVKFIFFSIYLETIYLLDKPAASRWASRGAGGN